MNLVTQTSRFGGMDSFENRFTGPEEATTLSPWSSGGAPPCFWENGAIDNDVQAA
jgi:hypothetical protein